MKKTMAVLLVLMLAVVSLVGCGGTTSESTAAPVSESVAEASAPESTGPERTSAESGEGPALLGYRWFDIDILEGVNFLYDDAGQTETIALNDGVSNTLGWCNILVMPMKTYLATAEDEYERRIEDMEKRTDILELVTDYDMVLFGENVLHMYAKTTNNVITHYIYYRNSEAGISVEIRLENRNIEDENDLHFSPDNELLMGVIGSIVLHPEA